MSNTLWHYGVLGMRWGRRNGSSTSTTTSTKKASPDDEIAKKKNDVSSLSDEELRSKISRLELEKRLNDLSKTEIKTKSTKGKDFVMAVLEKSGRNIGEQAMTYVIGTAVNKIAGQDVVNPKKGQKDK